MSEHFDLLAVELNLTGLCDSGSGRLLCFELDVSEASSLTIWVKFELAGANWADSREFIEELLLGDCKVDVTHEHVRLGLHEVAFLQIATDVVVADLRVVKLTSTSLGLVQFEELEETVAVLALSLLVDVDDCLVDTVSHLLYMLV